MMLRQVQDWGISNSDPQKRCLQHTRVAEYATHFFLKCQTAGVMLLCECYRGV